MKTNKHNQTDPLAKRGAHSEQRIVGHLECISHLVEIPPEDVARPLGRVLTKRLIKQGGVFGFLVILNLFRCDAAIVNPQNFKSLFIVVSEKRLNTGYGISDFRERALMECDKVFGWNEPLLDGDEDLKCVLRVSAAGDAILNEPSNPPKDETREKVDKFFHRLCLLFVGAVLGYIAAGLYSLYGPPWEWFAQRPRSASRRQCGSQPKGTQ